MSSVRALFGNRTARKTASYSIMHMAVAMAVAFALSGSWVVAFSIGLIEPLVQTVAYHFHEKVWGETNRQGGAAGTVSPTSALPA
jgi:uncharacterized membrane protein